MSKLAVSCVVDDDPIFLFGMKILLKKIGFSNDLLVFKNGQEAIDGLVERLNNNQPLPEVIFLDLNMPIMDGWEFLEDFVKIPNHNREKVKIYVVSSSIDARDHERAKELNVVSNYFVKPITEEDLKKIMASL
ncbi:MULTISPECIES: response regulator [Flavobacteriaceae]|uniref:response regulator n=1 Tax=Flavobacteriaceae TaxID=49546 RepID=UPI0010AECCB6|nr:MULTISPECIES: response regulator [Flavobacteriaceae]NJB36981.1 response regulator [Croceivirga sp. JEA036]TKD65210.1 response regulator [Flavobacterium sp. ASW18X]